MDGDGSRSIFVLIIILIKAYFSVCEHAITEISDNKVKALAEKEKGYRKLLDLITNPRRMMIAFSIQKAFTSVLISIGAVLLFHSSLSKMLSIRLGLNDTVSAVISIVVISLLTMMAIVVFTDTIPRCISKNIKDKFAVKCVGTVNILIAVLTPFGALTSSISVLICKLLRIQVKNEKEVVTEEEILMMVEAGNETGIIEESQRTMINNIFGFRDVSVSDVMTHRTELTAVDISTKISDIVYIAINEGFSRIPIYENTVDNIIGILYVKDLLCLVGREHIEDFTISQFMRKVMFVPETSKCDDIFESLTLNKTQVAIVVDEYGGTAGMVTMEDLLEEIVGNIQDEYDDEEAEFSQISDNIYMIDGSADPEDIIPQLKAVLPDDHNYDTMSAMFVDLLGRIPEKDETPFIMYQNIKLTALVTEDNWVTKIKAEITETVQEE